MVVESIFKTSFFLNVCIWLYEPNRKNAYAHKVLMSVQQTCKLRGTEFLRLCTRISGRNRFTTVTSYGDIDSGKIKTTRYENADEFLEPVDKVLSD